MAEDEFDSELDAIIDSFAANRKAEADAAVKKKADDEAYYRAWCDHVRAVIEPTLQEIVARFRQKEMVVSVQKVPSPRRLGGPIPDAEGISLYSSDAAARLHRSVGSEYSLTFTVAERSGGTVPTVQVTCPGERIELVTMAQVTDKFVRQMALTYLRGKRS